MSMSFFKNATVYRFTQLFTTSEAALQEALETKPYREPMPSELATYGFIPPFDLGENSPLVESSGRIHVPYRLIVAKRTERNLPASVVREAVKKKVDQIEADQVRKVYKKERDQIKDDVVAELLPRAFLKHRVTAALIFMDTIIVSTASAREAEDLLSTLRECLGSLPVRPLTVKLSPSAAMTDWLKNETAASGFFALDECEFRDCHDDGGTVRCKGQDLTSDETKEHLSAGKIVTKLALNWEDKLSFVLDDKLTIKRLRFDDLLYEQADADSGEDRHDNLMASLIIAAGTFAEFVPALVEALGGEDVPQGI